MRRKDDKTAARKDAAKERPPDFEGSCSELGARADVVGFSGFVHDEDLEVAYCDGVGEVDAVAGRVEGVFGE